MRKNRKPGKVVESFGWIGVLLILLAYGLLSFEVIEAQSLWYHGLNLLGGLGIIIDALAVKNYQPAVLNIVWGMIAIYAIIKVFS